MKELIVFDLDGTLAESKFPIDSEMAKLLRELLTVLKVAIISGGAFEQFEKQFLANLHADENLKNLFLLPTCGTKFYKYESGWQKLYSEDFTEEEKKKITDALTKVASSEVKIEKTWGEQIEDRGSQITFSALGQHAPNDEKSKWDPDFSKRKKMQAELGKIIPEFSVRLGGMTSVDVTKPGIDKAYGINKLKEILNIPIDKMIFVGDAIFPGGNDYPAKEAGVLSIQVKGPAETKLVITSVIAAF
ncbi:MAG: HAD-IIB family hydrolase [Bacteroidetes bacterium]|nr:HAD-IIB family hydrolase [Bacteroidota bacterium]